MPDAAWPIGRHPPDSSRGRKESLVSTSPISFRHFISGSLSLAFLTHTCRAHGATFPTTLTTTALDRSSSGWFAASACTATAEGHQTTRPGSSISRTAPHPAAWSSTSSLLQRSCSHLCAESNSAASWSRSPLLCHVRDHPARADPTIPVGYRGVNAAPPQRGRSSRAKHWRPREPRSSETGRVSIRVAWVRGALVTPARARRGPSAPCSDWRRRVRQRGR